MIESKRWVISQKLRAVTVAVCSLHICTQLITSLHGLMHADKIINESCEINLSPETIKQSFHVTAGNNKV
jgi:hypothetical protein